MSIDFWDLIREKFPDIFELAKDKFGIAVLKIGSQKFIEKYDQIKKFLKKEKGYSSKSEALSSTEIEKYGQLYKINKSLHQKVIKKYMRPDDWSIYLLGQRALAEKKVFNMEEVRKIKSEAIQRKGTRGIRLINFALQGYYEEIIIPILKSLIQRFKTDSEIYKRFNLFLDKIILFFPRAFWVKNITDKDEIKKELIKRCVIYKFSEVNIHTIGKHNIDKIKLALEELSKEEFPSFNYDDKEEYGTDIAVTFKIKIGE